MGIQALGSKSGNSLRNEEHKDYPYLLNGLDIARPNSIPEGFMYLITIIDW